MLMKLEKMYNTNYFSLLKMTFEIYPEKLNWFPCETLQGKNTCQRQAGGKHSCSQTHYYYSAFGFQYILALCGQSAAEGPASWVFRASVWHFSSELHGAVSRHLPSLLSPRAHVGFESGGYWLRNQCALITKFWMI